ncbi:MAG: hypothetical protein KBC84_02275 [Proteobacteria bacterium]|nr:hypothetical protein [Pseudomonadota bacterium]
MSQVISEKSHSSAVKIDSSTVTINTKSDEIYSKYKREISNNHYATGHIDLRSDTISVNDSDVAKISRVQVDADGGRIYEINFSEKFKGELKLNIDGKDYVITRDSNGVALNGSLSSQIEKSSKKSEKQVHVGVPEEYPVLPKSKPEPEKVYSAHSYDSQKLIIGKSDGKLYDILTDTSRNYAEPKFTLAVLPDRGDGQVRYSFFLNGVVENNIAYQPTWVGPIISLPQDVSAESRNSQLLDALSKIKTDYRLEKSGSSRIYLSKGLNPELMLAIEEAEKQGFKVNISVERGDQYSIQLRHIKSGKLSEKQTFTVKDLSATDKDFAYALSQQTDRYSNLAEFMIAGGQEVSAEFRKSALEEFRVVPKVIMEDLLQNGYKINLVSSLTKVPALLSHIAYGASASRRLDSVMASTDQTANMIHIAEGFVRDGNTEKTRDHLHKIVAHEVGHAISDSLADRSLGYTVLDTNFRSTELSNSQDFFLAYVRDLEGMKNLKFSEADIKRKDYYLEVGHDGRFGTAADVRARQECLAEAVNILIRGKEHSSEPGYFLEAFPNTLTVVRDFLNKKYQLKLSIPE